MKNRLFQINATLFNCHFLLYKYFSKIKSNMSIKMIIIQSSIFVIQRGSAALQMNSVRYVYRGFGYLETPCSLVHSFHSRETIYILIIPREFRSLLYWVSMDISFPSSLSSFYPLYWNSLSLHACMSTRR